jgi:hypothetical protein
MVTIVMPAIPPKGAKNQLRRETAYRPYPSICGMDGEGKNRRWPNSGGCYSPPLQRKPLIFVAWAARPNHDAPHWPGRFFSNLVA